MKQFSQLLLVFILLQSLLTSCSQQPIVATPQVYEQPAKWTFHNDVKGGLEPSTKAAENEVSDVSLTASANDAFYAETIDVSADRQSDLDISSQVETNTTEPITKSQGDSLSTAAESKQIGFFAKIAADEDKKMEAFAVVGFVSGLVGLFVFGYVLGAVAIVFSAISLIRIKKAPAEKKGKGLAVTGLIIGIVDIVLLTALLLLL